MATAAGVVGGVGAAGGGAAVVEAAGVEGGVGGGGVGGGSGGGGVGSGRSGGGGIGGGGVEKELDIFGKHAIVLVHEHAMVHGIRQQNVVGLDGREDLVEMRRERHTLRPATILRLDHPFFMMAAAGRAQTTALPCPLRLLWLSMPDVGPLHLSACDS